MKSIALILIVSVAAAIAAPSSHDSLNDRDGRLHRVERKTTYVTVPAGQSPPPAVVPQPQYQPQEPQNTGLFAGAASAWKDTTGKALALFTSGNSKSANF